MSSEKLTTSEAKIDSVTLRIATVEDIPDIVGVHLNAFPNFFLSRMGYQFLALMYQSFIEQPKGIFTVADFRGALCGFCFGLAANGPKDWVISLKYWRLFFLASLKPIFKDFKGTVLRLAGHFLCREQSFKIPENSFFLRSIAVSFSAQGQGIGKMLLDDFEKKSIRFGAKSIVLTTDAKHNQKTLFFYTRLGYVVKKSFRQQGHRKMFLLQKKMTERNFDEV